MRHQNRKHKLGMAQGHRKSLIRNLASELIDHNEIRTTLTRCKVIRPYVEKLVTLAKTDSVANRRVALQKLNNRDAVQKLFKDVGPKFKERKGGYTRIVKIAEGRVGDNAPVGLISFVD